MHLADNLLEHPAGLLFVASFRAGNHLAELLLGHLRDNRAHRGRAEHVLGLSLELRFCDTHGDDRDQAGEDVIAFHAGLGVLEVDFQLARIIFDAFANLLGDALQETVDVHAAARSLDDVDEAAQRGVIAVDPAQGDIDFAGALDVLRVQFTFTVNGLCFLGIGVFAADAPDIAYRFAFGQEVDKILDAAGVEEFLDPAVGARRGCEDCLTCRLRFAIVGGVVRRSVFDLSGIGVAVSVVCLVDTVSAVGTVNVADARVGIVPKRVPGNARGVLRHVDFEHRIDGRVAGFGDILVDDGDFQSRNKEGCLTNPVDKLLIAEPRGIVENLRVGPVADTRARGLRRDLADDFKLSRTVLARTFERGVR